MRKYLTTTVAVGDVVAIELPGSEVCVHMRVAGKTMSVRVLDNWMAQLLTETGEPFSFPVTWGEAGIYRDALGMPYLSTYTDQPAPRVSDIEAAHEYALTINPRGLVTEIAAGPDGIRTRIVDPR